ncbi:MAG: pantetheine-phosphate adenylyltransferase [bacterium]|jgi:pantetheine-phosphate adenylyltransferase
MEKIALFPGSFDPITLAHIDILNRALPLFDKVYVGIGLNSNKQSLLTANEREEMLKNVFAKHKNIEVLTYEGLTVDICKKVNAQYMIRGIRSVSDFEYEKAISQMNHAMQPDIESIFVLSKPGFSAISSTIVRDILRNGGDITQFVPKEVAEYLLTHKR